MVLSLSIFTGSTYITNKWGTNNIGVNNSGKNDRDKRQCSQPVTQGDKIKPPEYVLSEALEMLAKSQLTAHMGSWVWDLNSGTGELSEAANEMFGLTSVENAGPGTLMHDFVMSCVHPEDRETHRQSMMQVMAGKPVDGYYMRIIRPDGTMRYIFACTRVILQNEDGTPVKIMGILQDVSRQKAYEDALKLDEARLEALLELNNMQGTRAGDVSHFALSKAIELTGSKIGLISLVDPDETTMEIYSVSAEMMDGWGADRKCMTFPVATGGLWTEPIRTRKPLIINDYSRPYPGKKGLPGGHGALKRLLIVPIVEDGRVKLTAMVGNKETGYDMSDVRQLTLLMGGVLRVLSRVRSEEALLEAKTRAELYVDLMSHDIMNLNQIALGYLELTRDQLKKAEIDTAFIDRSEGALKNMSRLVRNVRKIQKAKSSSMSIKPVDVSRVIDDVASRYTNLSGRDITINYTRAGSRMVQANELLQDVIENIVGNAVKHSGDPLTINITLSEESDYNGDYLKIAIEDNGPGISDSMKERTFSRLLPGESGEKGTGLGLYLVKTLVESYRGKVTVEDRVTGDYSKGARFVVLLPLSRQGPVASGNRARKSNS